MTLSMLVDDVSTRDALQLASHASASAIAIIWLCLAVYCGDVSQLAVFVRSLSLFVDVSETVFTQWKKNTVFLPPLQIPRQIHRNVSQI